MQIPQTPEFKLSVDKSIYNYNDNIQISAFVKNWIPNTPIRILIWSTQTCSVPSNGPCTRDNSVKKTWAFTAPNPITPNYSFTKTVPVKDLRQMVGGFEYYFQIEMDYPSLPNGPLVGDMFMATR